MMIRLVPMLAIWSWMRCSAPLPMATMTITAATPMMMPSMVSRVRILFLTMDLKATLIRFFHFMGGLLGRSAVFQRPVSRSLPASWGRDTAWSRMIQPSRNSMMRRQ